jgi:hypothetical protein
LLQGTLREYAARLTAAEQAAAASRQQAEAQAAHAAVSDYFMIRTDALTVIPLRRTASPRRRDQHTPNSRLAEIYGCGWRYWDRSQSEPAEISLRFRSFAIPCSPPTPVAMVCDTDAATEPRSGAD